MLAWSFSNTNFSIGDALVIENLPSYLKPKRPKYQRTWLDSRSKMSFFRSIVFILEVIIGCGFLVVGGLLVVRYKKRKMKREEEAEDWEMELGWIERLVQER